MHVATCPAAAKRQPTTIQKDPPLRLWLVSWVAGACTILILNFDSVMWCRVPVAFADLTPAGGLNLEYAKAIAMLISALTPLLIGLVTASWAGLAKVILAWRRTRDRR